MLAPDCFNNLKCATHYAAYTLVSYDTSGHVDAADAAVIKDAEVAIARAGDYALQAFLQKELVLLTVTSERFLRDWAATAHGTDCMLMIGTTTRASQSSGEKPSTCLPDLVRLDSGTDQKMDLASSHWATPSVVCDAGGLLNCRWLVLIHPIVLAPGNHRLRFGSSTLDGEFDTEVACRSGETIFATPTCEVTEWYPWLKRLTWSAPVKWGKMTGRVAFSPEVPRVPEKVSYFVLLNKGGKWLFGQD